MIHQIKNKIYNKVGIESQRTKNITKHVVLSFLYKGGSIIANLMLVPLTINYLDTENYGVWLTLSSFIAWFTFFDVGLGNGLRNKFAEAKAKGDLLLARAYVSSAYFTIGTVCIILTILFVLVNYFIDWTKVFNTSRDLYDELKILMPIAFGFFCLQLIAKLITTIYTADQHHSMQGKVTFYTNLLSLIAIWLMTLMNKSSLLVFGVIFSILPVLILLVLNYVAFARKYRNYRPTLVLWKMKYLRGIFGLGLVFFFVQVSGIILFSTDNFIISHLFSPSEVVPYNIAYKYFSIALMAFNIIASPFWSSFTDAYNVKDYSWVVNSMNNILRIALLFISAILIMIFVSQYIYEFWIGEKLYVPRKVTLITGVFFICTIFVTPYTLFLNGTGKIKLQAIQGFLAALINIPLALLFAIYFKLGASGVILATTISFLPSVILNPIQYKKIVTKTAKGIWNK